MTACTACGKQFEGNYLYCNQCGSLSLDRRYLRPSFGSTVWLLGVLVVIIALAGLYRSGAFDGPVQPRAVVTPPPPQDDLTRTVASCGAPTKDVLSATSKKHQAPQTRVLTYHLVSVKLFYAAEEAAGAQQWRLTSARNEKTNQVLQAKQLSKRLPCLRVLKEGVGTRHEPKSRPTGERHGSIPSRTVPQRLKPS
jgi:hypothetical protein